jgi:hypothetical protein
MKKLPNDIKNALDIGGIGQDGSYKKYFETTIVDVEKGADVFQDLNQDTKLHFKKNSFDLVILSQILEHLFFPNKILDEAKRVTKKYILIGLPNDLTIDNRIKFLLRRVYVGFKQYGHKYILTPETIDEFINKHFKKSEILWKWNMFGVKGGRIIPSKLRNFLADLSPSMFAREIYYLVEVSD